MNRDGVVRMMPVLGKMDTIGSQFMIAASYATRVADPMASPLVGVVATEAGMAVIRSILERPVVPESLNLVQDIRIVSTRVLYCPFLEIGGSGGSGGRIQRSDGGGQDERGQGPTESSAMVPDAVAEWMWYGSDRARINGWMENDGVVDRVARNVMRWRQWWTVVGRVDEVARAVRGQDARSISTSGGSTATAAAAFSGGEAPLERDIMGEKWTGLATPQRAHMLSAGLTDQEMVHQAMRLRDADLSAQDRHVLMRQMLQVLGDIPDAQLQPPKNVLFVCKLNPVTDEAALQVVFARWGRVVDTHVVREADPPQRSKCYGFVEFDSESTCNKAYRGGRRRQGSPCLVVDGRLLVVDFCQSVGKAAVRQLLERSVRSSLQRTSS